jgi:hypothetical protein
MARVKLIAFAKTLSTTHTWPLIAPWELDTTEMALAKKKPELKPDYTKNESWSAIVNGQKLTFEIRTVELNRQVRDLFCNDFYLGKICRVDRHYWCWNPAVGEPACGRYHSANECALGIMNRWVEAQK